jgi:N-acetylglutamate synthase-like GNAT family acetyltransferase
MIIRRARPSDLPSIVAMVGDFIQGTQYRSILPFLPDTILELADRVLQVGVIFVAEVDDRLVAMIAGFAVDEPIGRRKMLDELAWWVDPAYRRGSVGPKLLRCWEEWARQAGLEMVKMIAPAESPGVGEFLQRRGYQPIETTYILRLANGSSDNPAHRGTGRGLSPRAAGEGRQGAEGAGPGHSAGADGRGEGRGDESGQRAES